MAMTAVTSTDSSLVWTETWDNGTGLYTKTSASNVQLEQRPLTPAEAQMVTNYDAAMKPPRKVLAQLDQETFVGAAIAGGNIALTFNWNKPFDDTTYGYDVTLPPGLVGKVTWTEAGKTVSTLTVNFQAKVAAVAAATVTAMAYQV